MHGVGEIIVFLKITSLADSRSVDKDSDVA